MARSRQLVVCASVLLAAGCGGANGPSRTHHLARADKICAGVSAQLRALGTPQKPQQFPSFAAKAVPIIRDGLQRLRALEAPSEIAGRVQEFLGELGKSVDLIRRAGAAGKAKNATELQSIAVEAAGIAADAGREANAIGFRECGRIPVV